MGSKGERKSIDRRTDPAPVSTMNWIKSNFMLCLAIWTLAGTELGASVFTEMGKVDTDSLRVTAEMDSVFGCRSVQGREIPVFRFEGTSSARIVIVGGIHGNEPQSVDFATALVDSLNKLEPGTQARTIIVMPLLNPDGYALQTRKNANGIDLNRNFPTRDFSLAACGSKFYGGETAGSEPETCFLLELMDEEKPDLLVMLHTPLNMINSDGDSLGWGPRLAQELGLDYHAEIGYSTPGSVGTFFGKERGIPVITVEFPPAPDVWERFGAKLLGFLLDSSFD